MKPLKQTYFILLIVSINLLFAVLLGWWIWQMTASFQTINATPTTAPGVEILNVQGFNQLVSPQPQPASTPTPSTGTIALPSFAPLSTAPTATPTPASLPTLNTNTQP